MRIWREGTMCKWVLEGGLGALIAAALLLTWLPPALLAPPTPPGTEEAGGEGDWQQLWYNGFEEFHQLEPALDNNTVTNITVQLGATAFLHCPVRHKADRGQISWVRRRDWHILSSGMFTFTNDERFQILHGEISDDWTLQIKYVQKRDNGTYECQVSTGIGLLSHYVNLNIVVPEAFILGSGEHHVDTDSIINLVCIIEKSPTPPQYVFWYHNERMINYDTARGGITVETEPGPKSQSRLTIRGARDTDSGNYTCSASNTEPASIYVFVTEGDKMAVISRRNVTITTNMATNHQCNIVYAVPIIFIIGFANMPMDLR